eukprot:763959-Hanusia_phi.AAC.16
MEYQCHTIQIRYRTVPYRTVPYRTIPYTIIKEKITELPGDRPGPDDFGMCGHDSHLDVYRNPGDPDRD